MLDARRLLPFLAFAGLTFTHAQADLPDPFVSEPPPPPPVEEGDEEVQDEFLPPPDAVTIPSYGLMPMNIQLHNEAPYAFYEATPTRTTELTVAAPRPAEEPEPVPDLAVEETPPEEEEAPEPVAEPEVTLPDLAELPDLPPLTAQTTTLDEAPEVQVVAIANGITPRAILLIGEAFERLRAGDSVPTTEYVVERITATTVVLASGDHTVTLGVEQQ